MKADIHPKYWNRNLLRLRCGFHTRSTKQDIQIGICRLPSVFTGRKFVDTAGRVEKFTRRYGSTKRRAPNVLADSAFRSGDCAGVKSPFLFMDFNSLIERKTRPLRRAGARDRRSCAFENRKRAAKCASIRP
jgi:large subunit ribosomal protein L31